MWTYCQTTGIIYGADGLQFARGYAGRGEGKNNPKMEQVGGIGPLPAGLYVLGLRKDDTGLGPCAIQLLPDRFNVMYKRSDFWVHADSGEHPGLASRGCIVLGKERYILAESKDRNLIVVHRWEPVNGFPPVRAA